MIKLTTLKIPALVASAVLLGSLSLPAVAAPTRAASSQNAQAAQNLNTLLVHLKSMTANFSQTTTTAAGTKGSLNTANRSFSGNMQVQRPNQFRWQIAGNAAQLIVANGSSLWIYDKDLNQATRQRIDNQVGDTPALLLSGDPSKITANFTVTQPDANKNYYVLYPKASNANFKSLAIAFNAGNPVMMVLNDNLGQTTSIRFSQVRRNVAIPSSQFNFIPPKGVDIIDQ